MMKNFTQPLLLISTLFFSSFVSGQEMNDVITALRSGSSSKLAKHFDNRIDISLPGKGDNYSRTQAEMIMRDFFSTNVVRSFQVKHTGDNKDGSKYCTGILQTKNGDYHVILFMKQKDGKQLLQQLSFQLVE